MGFRCGIVGLANVGKSTIFNALTRAGVPAENYPFCTVDPNVGMVAVPDERLRELADLLGPERVVPTVLDFVDIAGLVRGAHKGEGLGNQFLSHIRAVDAIAHVVRCFDDPDVSHSETTVDPLRDVETVEFELIQKDLETVERRMERASKMLRVGDKQSKQAVELCKKMKSVLEDLRPLRGIELRADDEPLLREMAPLTLKPMFYVANLGEDNLDQPDNPLLDQLSAYAAERGIEVVPFYAKLESEIHELDEDEQGDFIREMGLSESGLSGIIHAGYQILDLVTFYTKVGPELRAWTVPRGTSAPAAAGRIHTDFENGFIKAEVAGFEQLMRAGSEARAKSQGLIRIEGRDYQVADGDVIHFRI